MLPDSNQQSNTSSILRSFPLPFLLGMVMSSMWCLCRSVTCTAKRQYVTSEQLFHIHPHLIARKGENQLLQSSITLECGLPLALQGVGFSMREKVSCPDQTTADLLVNVATGSLQSMGVFHAAQPDPTISSGTTLEHACVVLPHVFWPKSKCTPSGRTALPAEPVSL